VALRPKNGLRRRQPEPRLKTRDRGPNAENVDSRRLSGAGNRATRATPRHIVAPRVLLESRTRCSVRRFKTVQTDGRPAMISRDVPSRSVFRVPTLCRGPGVGPATIRVVTRCCPALLATEPPIAVYASVSPLATGKSGSAVWT
jgi:hypothetical protein